MPEDAAVERCLTLVAQLNAEQKWDLPPPIQQHYARQVAACYKDATTIDAAQLCTTIQYYHTEHALVEALRDAHHPDHAVRWSEWIRQTLHILKARAGGLDRRATLAMSLDDLVQEALYDLWRGVRTYQYRSRFRTWAFTVISNCFLRYQRARQAHKRSALPEAQSFEMLLAVSASIRHDTSLLPDEAALGALLAALVEQVLARQPDQRLRVIFQLWAYEDQPLRAIAERLNLSVTRVHGLLMQTLTLLRKELAIQDWVEHDHAGLLSEP